nr:hypothetical protein Q903MT_gene6394 [Picea sitchensis]
MPTMDGSLSSTRPEWPSSPSIVSFPTVLNKQHQGARFSSCPESAGDIRLGGIERRRVLWGLARNVSRGFSFMPDPGFG